MLKQTITISIFATICFAGLLQRLAPQVVVSTRTFYVTVKSAPTPSNSAQYMPTEVPAPKSTPAPSTTPDASCSAQSYPFCVSGKLNGFQSSFQPDTSSAPDINTSRKYFHEALNWLRVKSCLAPFESDSCLDGVATKALSVGLNHQYFADECIEKGNCECGLRAENVGLASGSNMLWTDSIQLVLCAMIEEPYGTDHRANIQNAEYTKSGVGIECQVNGCKWTNDFA